MRICCWYGRLRKALPCRGCAWDIWCAVMRASGENPQTAAGMEDLSVFAQKAGIVCAEQAEQYLQDTVEYVKTERAYLREGLEALTSG